MASASAKRIATLSSKLDLLQGEIKQLLFNTSKTIEESQNTILDFQRSYGEDTNKIAVIKKNLSNAKTEYQQNKLALLALK